MNSEIKEILDDMKEIADCDYTTDWCELNYKDTKLLYEYITNLEQKVKEQDKQITEYQDEIFARDNSWYDMQD